MKSAQNILLQTCCLAVGLLFFFSSTSAEFEDIHVDSKPEIHEACDGISKWSSSDEHSIKRATVEDTYESLWTKNEDIAEQTLKLPFLQQMQFSELQADFYMDFMIQDIYYVMEVTGMLKEMTTKVENPEIKAVMQNRFDSYSKFMKSLLKQFNLKDVSIVTPIPALEKYLSDYRSIMKEDPIFFVVSLVPCSRLWLWIANKLKMSLNNPYYCWKEANMGGHPEKHYKDIINKYVTGDKINKAQQIFRQQMENERDFFSAWPKE